MGKTNILAIDIGGTNSRFARFTPEGESLRMRDAVWLPTTGAPTFAGILENLSALDFPLDPKDADVTVIAVPGPVQERVYSDPPNVPWDIDLRVTPITPGKTAMINDFVAQSYATRTPAVDDAVIIQDGRAEEDRAISIIGAGTGLGHGAILPVEGRWVPVPSEGGHTAFPFKASERDLEAFVLERTGHSFCQTETLVTGGGLALLHEFLTGDRLHPSEVAGTLVPGSKTLSMFAGFYGRVARQWCVATISLGGVFVTGGVAAKNHALVTAAEFTQEFQEHPVYNDLLSTIPVVLNVNEDSGLWGAAFCGLQMLEAGR